MLIDGRAHEVLRLKHLNSIVSFEDWAKERLSIFPENTPIPVSKMRTLLEYLKDTVKEQKIIKKKEWIKSIDKLIERLAEGEE
jgi:hypothetical protein